MKFSREEMNTQSSSQKSVPFNVPVSSQACQVDIMVTLDEKDLCFRENSYLFFPEKQRKNSFGNPAFRSTDFCKKSHALKAVKDKSAIIVRFRIICGIDVFAGYWGAVHLPGYPLHT